MIDTSKIDNISYLSICLSFLADKEENNNINMNDRMDIKITKLSKKIPITVNVGMFDLHEKVDSDRISFVTENFLDENFEKVNDDRYIALNVDESAVNVGIYKGIITKLRDSKKNLFDVGCVLHILHHAYIRSLSNVFGIFGLVTGSRKYDNVIQFVDNGSQYFLSIKKKYEEEIVYLKNLKIPTIQSSSRWECLNKPLDFWKESADDFIIKLGESPEWQSIINKDDKQKRNWNTFSKYNVPNIKFKCKLEIGNRSRPNINSDLAESISLTHTITEGIHVTSINSLDSIEYYMEDNFKNIFSGKRP